MLFSGYGEQAKGWKVEERMKKQKFDINWTSKLLDLLIFILGITIAFRLNTYRTDDLEAEKRESYLKKFQEESQTNLERLKRAIEGTQATKAQNDTLQRLLVRGAYQDPRIPEL